MGHMADLASRSHFYPKLFMFWLAKSGSICPYFAFSEAKNANYEKLLFDPSWVTYGSYGRFGLKKPFLPKTVEGLPNHIKADLAIFCTFRG